MSCGVGLRCRSDPPLLWLCCRPAAVVPIQPLAWEPPYAMCVTLKRQTKNLRQQPGKMLIYERVVRMETEEQQNLPSHT